MGLREEEAKELGYRWEHLLLRYRQDQTCLFTHAKRKTFLALIQQCMLDSPLSWELVITATEDSVLP